MVDNQTTIFEMIYPTFKITKPIRLITLFSGYDSQALALKYLGVEFELYRTCEWAIKSIQALKDLHFGEDTKDYSKDLETSQIKEFLLSKGISSNYNEPMNKSQINRLNEKQVRTIYNSIKATHNLVNIQQVKGDDLGIVDTDKYNYIMTYSFPCQDLSLAGKGKGMSDTSTRSGMLWEVERILTECKELGTLPSVLVMENVPQVHSTDNMPDFHKWQLKLEELGYRNYWKDLIATDYGIPQTRNRCFMVSILGNYNYTFPKTILLKLKLKDMLENQVDEKYYLSNKQIKSMEAGNYNASKPSVKLEITDKGLCQTLDTMSGGNRQPLIRVKNATQKGYLEATEGDGIDISGRMQYHRGTVQKGKTQSITTSGGENNGVIVKKIGNYSPSNHNASRIVDKEYSAPTVMENHGTITAIVEKHYGISTNESEEWQKEPLEEKSRTILANKSNGGVGCIDTNLRIRKLTPRECFRLMGVKDEDYDKVAKNQSDSSLYHLAGDSIVVNVLMAIFKEMM